MSKILDYLRFLLTDPRITLFQCDKFSCYGAEVFFVMVQKSDNNVSSKGTQKGVDFLRQRADILQDFAKFTKGVYIRITSNLCIYIM